jgi:hypothetical protein
MIQNRIEAECTQSTIMDDDRKMDCLNASSINYNYPESIVCIVKLFIVQQEKSLCGTSLTSNAEL